MAAFSSVVTEVTSVAELADIQSGKLVLFFWAAWHEPSQPGGQMDSVIAQLAADAASVSLRFAKVEAEAVPELSERFAVSVAIGDIQVESDRSPYGGTIGGPLIQVGHVTGDGPAVVVGCIAFELLGAGAVVHIAAREHRISAAIEDVSRDVREILAVEPAIFVFFIHGSAPLFFFCV